MRDRVPLVAAALLLVSALVAPRFGHANPLPPAFGKELVPDEQSQERNESNAAEIEEQQEQKEQKNQKKHPVAHPGQRGRKLHIELDGDEDGGGDEDGDDGGEF